MNGRRLVIVGGGVAGATAARAARGEYPDAEIVLLSSEPVPFYNRIALGSVMIGARDRGDLVVLAPDLLEDRGVDCRWGDSAKRVDLERSEVLLESGDALAFDRLILATGTTPVRPPVPGIDGPWVRPLWTLDQALGIRDGLRARSRVVVIGGGVLGLETAFDLGRIGIDVCLVEARDVLAPGLLDGAASELVTDELESRGVRVLTGAPVTGIESAGERCRVHLGNDGKIEADMAVLVAGVAPDVALARSAGLETRRGILVDRYMRTSHPRVLAAGSCVELDGGVQALWNPARDQGRTAGINAFEVRAAAPPASTALHAKTPGMPLFLCGRTALEEPGDDVLVEADDTTYRALRLDARGRLVGAILVGDSTAYHVLERAIERGEVVPETARSSATAVIEALSPPRAPTEYLIPGWVCHMCGYNAEGELPPEVCPVCGVGRDQFLAA